MVGYRSTCPLCQETIQRSRSKSVIERLIRVFTRYRLYRCSACNWRGWLSQSKLISDWKRFVPTLVAWILTIIIILLLSFHLIQSSEETRDADSSNQVSR